MDKLNDYKNILLEDLDRTAKFWLENAWDKVNGGIYTSLDREGNVYSTDKSVWMQGRTAWTYSYLCNVYGINDEYLALAKSCIDFLEDHCVNHDADERLYFTVTAEGEPLRQRRYWFSESFYILGNAEYGALVQDKTYTERAVKKYEFVKKLISGEIEDPVGMPAKTNPETREFRGLGVPMIFMNVASVLHRTDPENRAVYEEDMRNAAEQIIEYHIKEDLQATLENVGLDGEAHLEFSEGRLVNPGHVIECAWFMIQTGDILDDKEIKEAGQRIYDMAVASGWDKEHGGITYFQDVLGKPVYQLESDMKLWWPQSEMLIASIYLYRETQEEKYLEEFEEVLTYIEQNFLDKENGGWYGYLHYDNTQAMSGVKGGIFKGPFHELRALVLAEQAITTLLE